MRRSLKSRFIPIAEDRRPTRITCCASIWPARFKPWSECSAMVAMMPVGNVGRSVSRLEGRAKVTGRAEYVHHLRLPGMLYGKIFRSTMPHALIKSVDISAAKAVDGVFRVVTIDDIKSVIPHPYYGPAFHDQPILADGKVRFAGEPVAVVLASDPRVAEYAAGLITAEYEELPAVMDEVEAETSDTCVHEELKPAATFPDLQHLKGRRHTNVA